MSDSKYNSMGSGDYSAAAPIPNAVPVYSEEDLEHNEEESEHGHVLYRINFADNEKAYVSYRTWQYVLISCLLILMYGIGLFFLMWTPVIRYIARTEFRNRRVYVSSESVVVKTNAPAPCCCPCSTSKKEKHVALPLITDVILTQGWFEKRFGLWSIKLENAGQAGNAANGGGGYDVALAGMTNPKVFKRVVLLAASAKRSGHTMTPKEVQEIISNTRAYHPPSGPVPNYNAFLPAVAPQSMATGIPAEVTAIFTEMNNTLKQLLAVQQHGNGGGPGVAQGVPAVYDEPSVV